MLKTFFGGIKKPVFYWQVPFCPVLFLRGLSIELSIMLIQLIQVLKEMEKKDENGRLIPFTIEFYTADRQKATGGNLVKLENAVLNYNPRVNVVTADRVTEKNKFPRKPNHYTNATRNARLPNGEIRKFHIRLIETFNGQTVHW